MDARKQMLKGSPSRDLFKQKHKLLHPSLFACDIDFVFVEKSPTPDIVAIVDFKNATGDDITFSEVIAYNAILMRGIAVYIITGDAESGCFTIFRWEGGHHGKPKYHLIEVHRVNSWVEYEEWEKALRAYKTSRFTERGNLKRDTRIHN